VGSAGKALLIVLGTKLRVRLECIPHGTHSAE